MANFTTRSAVAFVATAALVLVSCGGDLADTAEPRVVEPPLVDADQVPEEDMRTIREILDEQLAEAAAELDLVPMGPDGCPPGYVADVSAYSDPMRELDDHLRELESQALPGLMPDMSELQEMLGESIEMYDQMSGVCVPEVPGDQPELTDDEVLEQFCQLVRDAVQNRPDDLDQYEVVNPQAICGVRG